MREQRSLRVFVYRNLHLSTPQAVVWSVRSQDTGKVIAHTHAVMLRNAEFRVGQGGRRKVIETRQKNIHAGVVGDLVIDPNWFPQYKELEQAGVPITYNPYKYDSFVKVEDESSVKSADMVWLNESGKVFAGAPRLAKAA